MTRVARLFGLGLLVGLLAAAPAGAETKKPTLCAITVTLDYVSSHMDKLADGISKAVLSTCTPGSDLVLSGPFLVASFMPKLCDLGSPVTMTRNELACRFAGPKDVVGTVLQ